MVEGPMEPPPAGGKADGTADGNGDGNGDGVGGPAAPPAPRRRMKRQTRVSLLVIAVVAVVVAAVLVVVYVVEGGKYVTTDNAQIDGDRITVNAPGSGTLVDWTAHQGSQLLKNHTVGRIRIQGGFVQPQQAIRAPGDATVVVDNGVEGAFVAAGTELAVAYDFSRIYVTARVDETDIDDVHVGQPVDIAVDAFPGVDLHGSVEELQGGAAGVFSPFPQSNTSGNYQKVTQVIPVRIGIEDTKDLQLVPGMNVTVKIHKGG
ncbi:efflux RND transporter periplasmic adaptor subunit [Pseudonocardia kujensis]|uniref:HlyD family secretion protein n=1 Tax=Pseudonocardia kujensis TaxID=1128675 RepID=UPI001E61173C|nr:efflux RND transporter periplasmic adaptor subunit [Pseudonocardia kujensis]MCE0765310.1 efflux RND transporter periplasmic adaptor subunit [Pseudonocardia kujensis]